MKKETQAYKLDCALSAARSIIREKGGDPADYTPNAALDILDDEAKKTSDAVLWVAWYLTASDNQIRLFKSEWRKAQSRKKLYQSLSAIGKV